MGNVVRANFLEEEQIDRANITCSVFVFFKAKCR